MNFGRFVVKQHVMAALMMIFILIFGLLTLTTLRKEIFPSFEFNYITIQTFYPGASAVDIENIITNPIEDAIQSVKGIEQITSTSFEGLSSVLVQLKSDVDDPTRAYNDIKSAVDRVQDLPNDVLQPTVTKLEIDIPVITVSLSSTNMSEADVRRQAKILETRLKDVPAVSAVGRAGWRNRQIWVEVDPNRMIAYNVALSQIISTIKMRNVNMPAGKVSDGSKEFLIKTSGEIQDAAEVPRLIIRANDQGNTTAISGVASVTDTFAKKVIINKTMGRSDISLIIQKKEKDDALKLVDRVRKVVEEYQKTAPPGIYIQEVNDVTPRIKLRLDTLTHHGLIGIAMVLVILFIFMNPTVSVLTSLAIPFSFLTTFIAMNSLGMSINMISLFGLILVLGMIVDQGIIVAENSYRYLEKGLAPEAAVEKGVNEVIMPVISGVLTTVAAFAPLLFIPGISGKFIHDIPAVVIIALGASLVQAFFILPSNLAATLKPMPDPATIANEERCLKDPKAPWLKRAWTWIRCKLFMERNLSASPGYKKFVGAYLKLITFALRRRWQFTLFSVLGFILCVFIGFSFMKFELFSSRGIEQFTVTLKTRSNSSLENTERQVAKIEKLILGLRKNELKEFTTKIGTDQDRSLFGDQDSNLAIISVNLTDERDRKRTAEDIIKDLKKRSEGAADLESIQFQKLRQGPPVGKPVSIDIRGDSFGVLLAAAEDVKKVLSGINGVYDVDMSYKEGKEELRISIDDRKAAITGVSVAQVAGIIRTAYEGMKASSIRLEGESVDIVVKFNDKSSGTLDNLKKIYIPNMMGQMIPLSAIAEFRMEKSVKKVDHIDLKKTINVFAEIDSRKITSRKANGIAKKALRDLPARYPGLIVKFTGEEKESNESVQGLANAFLLAILLIYIVLAVSFQSFTQPVIIMITILYGLIGIILALAVHGLPLSFFGLMGIIALAGVIVHDGILLIDFIKRERAVPGQNLTQAIITAAQKRFRPIILTAGTAAVGLLPMAYSIGGGDVILQPLAVAFMWGLIFGTFLTLVLLPTIYMVFEDISVWARAKLGLKLNKSIQDI